MQRVLVIGASSAIATATARCYAERGARLFLIARDAVRLGVLAADLAVRGAEIAGTATLDVNDFAQHEPVLAQARERLGALDVVLIAHGTLGDQRRCEASVPDMLRELGTNAVSVVALAAGIATVLASQGQGTLAVISSVAGDRGRQSNYVYGSAKAMVSAFLSGLRQRLHASGAHVLTIKPGFVDTPMTAAFPKGPLWASPERVARGIVRAVEQRRDVVYLPAFWRPVMLAVRAIPERLFKRLAL